MTALVPESNFKMLKKVQLGLNEAKLLVVGPTHPDDVVEVGLNRARKCSAGLKLSTGGSAGEKKKSKACRT